MSKADVEQRRLDDRERYRLRELDKQDNGQRLYEWTVNEMASKGRPPLLNESAKQLGEALAFVSVAGTKDIQPWNKHVMLSDGWAIAGDGQMFAGHPIQEDLACCPQLEKFKFALGKTGKTLSITQMPSGKISLQGDKLSVKIDCLPMSDMPDFEWDDAIAPVTDTLKDAFKLCAVLADENAHTVLEASLLLEANTCTGTNRHIIMQYWHGINLPPKLVVPKIFANAVAKIKTPLVGFGWTEGTSITLHFEGGAWIKTLLYADPWPDTIDSILSRPSSPKPVLAALAGAIETVGKFSTEGVVLLSEDHIRSHLSEELGAKFDVDGLEGKDKQLDCDLYAKIAPFVKTIDTTTHEDRIMFFGDSMRGTLACLRNALDS